MAVVYIFANFFVQMYNLQSAGKLVIKMYQLWNWGLFDKSTIVAWTTISEKNNRS